MADINPITSSTGGGVQGQGPAVQLVNEMITTAVQSRASDIHIEPRRAHLDVRMRVDGVLYSWKQLPKDMQDIIVARVKVMADLDINEKRLPQDGRISVNLMGKPYDMRISTLPVLYGEKLVMRLLDRSMSVRALDGLDFSPQNRAAFEELIRKPLGLILVTGPTRSGKTTTLYSALNVLRSTTNNIVTCEDPIEYDMEGINQSAVFEKIGLTFARQLRAILRQDPDIVLVGEIRDAETAEIAFRAGMTGHLVLSTLHSNDAPTAVTRLLDMGVPPFLISSGLTGIVAQRLVRKLDPAARTQALPDARAAALLSLPPNAPVWVPNPNSQSDGYKGRMGVHEVFAITERFQRLIIEQVPGSVLRREAAQTGMIPIMEDAKAKMHAGLTSPDEVLRQVYVAGAEFEDEPVRPLTTQPIAALPSPD